LAVVKGAGLVMRAVIEEGDGEVAARMQNLAWLREHYHVIC